MNVQKGIRLTAVLQKRGLRTSMIEVLSSIFVHLMNFGAKNPRLHKVANRYRPF
jgi:hypothetical protein